MSNLTKQEGTTYSVARPPEQLVGRSKEQENIVSAIARGVRVVYIEGGGGIGKTRLLSEAPKFIPQLAREAKVQPAPIVLDIIDFYNTAMHSSLSLEEALVDRIKGRPEGDGQIFTDFIKVLEKYRAGHGEESHVHESFVQAFNEWAKEQRVVLCFDTAEALEYSRDASEVIADCEIEDKEISAIEWIRENLKGLANTTLLIAGRPTHTLRHTLREKKPDAAVTQKLRRLIYWMRNTLCGKKTDAADSPDEWLYLNLRTLSEGETRAYFAASPYGREPGKGDYDEETIERVWLLTDGRPILISLTIDWLHQWMELQELYQEELETLRQMKKEGGERWQERRERFEMTLVRQIRRLDTPMDLAVYYAARARKGFTAHILHQLLCQQKLIPKSLGLSEEQTQEIFDQLTKLSFVKHPYGAREGWYFLHDEMYDLINKYVWSVDYPGYTHQAETARFLAETVYGEEKNEDELIYRAAQKVQHASFHTELLETRRQLDILKTEQLYYWLEADPKEGYHRYRYLNLQAISHGNREWDDMLRVEFHRFLRAFPDWARVNGLIEEFDPESENPTFADFVNRDARIAWVHRLSARGDYKHAERIARKLLRKYPDWGDSSEAAILLGQGAAMVRLGKPESKKILKQARDILQKTDPKDAIDYRIIQHYIGSAYLYAGLRARDEWDLEEAVRVYGEARDFFDQSGDEIAAARALNNSAYILVKQGKYHEAISAAQETIRIRDKLGDIVGKGLSINTLAIAVNRAGNNINASSLAWEALELLRIAKESGYPALDRAIAMVYINLGCIERHRARRERPQLKKEVMHYWQRAENYLLKAKDLAMEENGELKGSLEPYYVFELYNQLGLLYSNWANWVFTRNPPTWDEYYRLMALGDESFARADDFTSEDEYNLPLERADNLEDWAWVFHLRRAYSQETGEPITPEELREKVFELLDQAESLALGTIGDVEPKKGLQTYYILGSIHHQRGRFWHKFDKNIQEAMQEYALSIAYYNLFALNPLDPLERRERIREHVRYTLETMLEEKSEESMEQTQSVCTAMVQRIKQEDLLTKEGMPDSADEIDKWLDNILKILSWEDELDLEEAVQGKTHEFPGRSADEIAAVRALNDSVYILVKQGKYHEAISAAQEIIETRDKLGDIVGKGLSMNTLAIAVNRAGNNINASSLAWEALELLQMAKKSGYPALDRTIAMVYINLGRIERHRARRERPHLTERIVHYWQRSEKYLLKAKDLAMEENGELEDDLEPHYVFELYNQLGLLYSNWANWIFTRNPPTWDEYYRLMALGDEFFARADAFTSEDEHNLPLERADNLEDWAWVFHLRRAYGQKTGETIAPEELRERVFELLDRAESLAQGTIGGVEPKRGLQAYYILGSIHHQRGRFWHKFDKNILEAMQEYALSIAYYNQFALNPLDPLERRERIRKHIRYVLEDMLEEESEEESIRKAQAICTEMVQEVERAKLPMEADELDRWLERMLKTLSWEMEGK